MLITDVEAIVLRQPNIQMVGDGSQDTVLILVHTDEGITGIGEVDSAPFVVKQMIDMPASHSACVGLKEIVVGEDAFNVEKIWNKMYEKSIYYGRRSAAIHAMSGIDIAIYDAIGKKLQLPVSQLLGGTYKTEIPAYCSVLMPSTRAEIQELVARHMPKGYLGMKLGWGALGQTPEMDVQLAEWARLSLGDRPYLMLDIGMRWRDVKEAIQTVRNFEEYKIRWVEEPFHPDMLDAYTRLMLSADTHISCGEEVGTLYEFYDLARLRCADILQPDLSRCGGFTVARKITDLAMLHTLQVIPHAFKTNILMAATLQYIASLPHSMMLEFCEQDTPLRQELTYPLFSIDQKGFVQIPQKPGLGIELNWDAVNKFRVM